ncbi:MAG: sigma-70 family RNA polymerase sigma factor [Tannerella sp.]|jgi:RNA polymerase sigma-70 factor (ECF subfamily)|nr:sigma-70 family RNA polymerase sigma factor [Tannerella sp.]
MIFLRNKPVGETDEELLLGYRATGSTECLGRLYDRYIPLVYGLCLKYLQGEEDAQDAVMQLFEELPAKVQAHDIRDFRPWLYSVARNHCLQVLRSRSHAVQVELYPNFMDTDESLHLFDEEDDGERLSALDKCMEKLPETQQRAIRLFFMEDKSYADIVDITGYSLKGVKSYIQNGKRNLKICIEQATR